MIDDKLGDEEADGFEGESSEGAVCPRTGEGVGSGAEVGDEEVDGSVRVSSEVSECPMTGTSGTAGGGE